jgi:hypothetical protein
MVTFEGKQPTSWELGLACIEQGEENWRKGKTIPEGNLYFKPVSEGKNFRTTISPSPNRKGMLDIKVTPKSKAAERGLARIEQGEENWRKRRKGKG